MYKAIAAHPTVRELFADMLVKQGTQTPESADGAREEALHDARAGARVAQAGTGFRRADVRAGAGGRRRHAREPACRSTACARSTRACSPSPPGFTFHKKLERGRAAPPRRAGESAGAVGRLGDRRGAGVCHHPRGRHPDPVDRRRRRARHVQPAPRRVPRRRAPARQFVPLQDFPQARASFEIHNSALSRERGHRLRVRLQHPGAGSPRDLGSAVRRFHQRRAGDPRPVRHVGPREVGTEAVARAACCRTATKARGRSIRARAPSDSCRRPPTSTCAW